MRPNFLDRSRKEEGWPILGKSSKCQEVPRLARRYPPSKAVVNVNKFAHEAWLTLNPHSTHNAGAGQLLGELSTTRKPAH